jgi:glycerol-3-phosphate dehydrogenase
MLNVRCDQYLSGDRELVVDGANSEAAVQRVDVIVIGGGIVGCAILRELTRYDASVALLEQRPDVCDATSKANSAIVHTGFDAPPGTLEGRLLADARDLWPQVTADLHIPFLQTGAVMIATTEQEQAAIVDEIVPQAERNGVALVPLTREGILDAAPYITDTVCGGVLVEGESVIDPFWATRAYCESAIRNGASVRLGHAVTEIDLGVRSITVKTNAGTTFESRMVVNAAGLWADEVARLVGDDSFTITPRKGQFIVSENDHGIGQIVLPVPSKVSKGILVAPIVFGGILLGPTAEDVTDKGDVSTTVEGFRRIRAGVVKLVPSLSTASSIRQFAGLRAVSSKGGYIIETAPSTSRFLNVAGIRSTGLSASPAIARHVGQIVRDELALSPCSSFEATLPEFLSEARPDEGEVVCLCRSITRGEILAALRSSLPPTTLDGLKRRTGVMLGDCQGNICIPRLIGLFQQHVGRDPWSVNKDIPGSSLVFGRLQTEVAEPLTGRTSVRGDS